MLAVPVVLAALLAGGAATGAFVLAGSPSVYRGSLGAAPYLIEIPHGWNRVLLLYSHGYVGPGRPSPAQDAPDAAARAWLLDHRYALAGSGYGRSGWAVKEGIAAQRRLLEAFRARFGHPRQVIAWGESMGGLITAALALDPPAGVEAALPMCGVLSGTPGFWDRSLTAAYAFKTLLAPRSGLQLVDIAHPAANYALARRIFTAARSTPQGRARLALVGALAGIPGWYAPDSPPPAASNLRAWDDAQAAWESRSYLYFAFEGRAELEARAGGNPSGDAGVDFAAAIERAPQLPEVESLYTQAGVSLAGDLAELASGDAILPRPSAAAYAARYAALSGELTIPVLTLHTTGDGLVPAGVERAFASSVGGGGGLLRQVYVSRAGHCTFTGAEALAALEALRERLSTGRWIGLGPASMNARARGLGPDANRLPWPDVAAAPAFVRYAPPLLAGA